MGEQARINDEKANLESILGKFSKKESGVRFKAAQEVSDAVKREIDDLDSVIIESSDAENDKKDKIRDEKFKEVLIKYCGQQYWDFLESGHPLARFWVQLKNGFEVIPKSEYYYYLQTVLEIDVNGPETFGSNRMKLDFLRRFGFESDEEVEDYLQIILEESDVESLIGVE